MTAHKSERFYGNEQLSNIEHHLDRDQRWDQT